MTPPTYNLNTLAKLVGGTFDGTADALINGVADLGEAAPHQASWLSNERHGDRLKSSGAGVVLVPQGIGAMSRPVIRCEQIDRSVALLLGAFAQPPPTPTPGIDERAIVHETAVIGADVSIGPYVVIEAGVKIGARCVLCAGVFVGCDTTIGDDCVLWPNVVIRHGCTLGRRVTIYPNAVIGADGFGFYFDEGRHNRVPHIGGVVLGNDVEIGACSCVDRAKFGYTSIGQGTKIDNLVQVGHNVRIGDHCVLAGQAGVAGSVQIGDFCALGGQVGITDNVTLGRGVSAAGGDTTITHDVAAGLIVSGYPAQEHRKELRDRALLRRLPKIVAQLRDLVERVERIESAAHDRP